MTDLPPGARAALAAIRAGQPRTIVRPIPPERRSRRKPPPRRVVLELTPAQLRTVNEALALYEVEVEGDGQTFDGHAMRLVVRTRGVVHRAMSDNRVEA